LGNGLVAARLGIAQSTEGSDQHRRSLRTHCLPKGFLVDDWDYSGHIWVVRATDNANFDNCLKSTKKYVQSTTEVHSVPELAEKDIYVFSYFHDRAVQASIVPHTIELIGGVAKVGDFKAAAMKSCSLPAEAIGPEHWQPWQCLDLTYIYTLLHHGYGLPDDKELQVSKKLRGMEVSWALGAAYHLLNTYHEDLILKKQMEEVPPVEEEPTIFVTPSRQRNVPSQSFFQRLFDYLSDKATMILSFFNLVS
jgi:ectonucleoside triphosphate diphosphohydrolase 5/6